MTRQCSAFCHFLRLILLFCLLSHPLSSLAEAGQSPVDDLEEPLYNPFLERYVLDELKSLRTDQLALRTEMADKIAEVRVAATDRSVRYATDTVNNLIYIITAALSVLVLAGWSSLREAQNRVEELIDSKVNKLTEEYEQRLHSLEEALRQRSDEILEAQQAISESNQIHSLWMRAGLESSVSEKVKLYDEILTLRSDDVEAITYKADAVQELGNSVWAHELANKAIELDDTYALAYWQRACANAELGHTEEALNDVELAISQNPSLSKELSSEQYFESLKGLERFDQLLVSAPTSV